MESFVHSLDTRLYSFLGSGEILVPFFYHRESTVMWEIYSSTVMFSLSNGSIKLSKSWMGR